MPGSLSEPRGLLSVPRGPLPRLSPVVPGHCPSSPAPSPGPDISALQVGEGVEAVEWGLVLVSKWWPPAGLTPRSTPQNCCH